MTGGLVTCININIYIHIYIFQNIEVDDHEMLYTSNANLRGHPFQFKLELMQSSVLTVLIRFKLWLWPPAVLYLCGSTKTPLMQQLPDVFPACRKQKVGTIYRVPFMHLVP